jgi:hypothetical protein
VRQCGAKSTTHSWAGGAHVKPGRPCPDAAYYRHGRWYCYAHAKRAGWRAPVSERGHVVRSPTYWDERYAEHIRGVNERIRVVCGEAVQT